jgi:hypothetical protein
MAARKAGASRAVVGVIVAEHEALEACRTTLGEVVTLETRL